MAKHTLKGEVKTKRVWLDGEELTPEESQKFRNHSPDGFNWGYYGSGPAQLALAIVLKITGAHSGYDTFRSSFVSQIEYGKDFEVDFDDSMFYEKEVSHGK